MFFFNTQPTEYLELFDYISFLDNLLLSDEYLSRKQYYGRWEKLSNTVNEFLLMDEKRVLSDWCKKNKVKYTLLSQLLIKYQRTADIVKAHNDDYINKHLKKDSVLFDSLLVDDDPSIILDEDQRRVVLSDEDYTLVIAGAGAGKTTTIEAKVKYLVENKGVGCDKILIVSFTKKATDELINRFKRLKLPVPIATFHSIGNSIIKENTNEKHNVVDQAFMYKVIEEYLLKKLDDEYFIKKIMLFFASYLNIPFDVEDVSLLFKTLAKNDNVTIKEELATLLKNYQKEQTKKRVTINDERVRSYEECRIANFLYINGVDYIYEPIYQHGFDNSTKPYCPDFLIKQNGKEIYLEHFGITEEGENARFSAEELDTYKRHIKDKIALHRKHGTKLIYTFSKYRDGRDVMVHLKELLQKEGVSFNPKRDVEIYKQLASNAEDKYFSKFILLICNFINRFKVCNYDFNTKFDEWQYSITSERTKLFLEIVKNCYYIYETQRLDKNSIDFEDMINNAVNILDQRIKSNDMLPYEYILVDEYQDISLQRFDLCEKLAKASHAKIVAVGDDWQSIFRFSGARVDLFTRFEEKMGYANILKITNTYRNSQELIDIAGGFVMRNEKQIKKDLRSRKSIIDPVILMSYDDSYEKDDKKHGPFYRLGEAIEKAFDDIVLKNGENSSVFLIGRYNYEGKNLLMLDDFFAIKKERLVSKKYPKLKISFLTAHASKGLGCDNVIIINGKDDVLGFPSKIEDDPVMKLVIKDEETIDYEEERRLFYVALTRTKNRVYIITPQYKPSKFIQEIKEQFTNIVLRGGELSLETFDSPKYKCPICSYPLQRRGANFKFLGHGKRLWICSNDPEVCGFLTNDLNGNKFQFSISKCPECFDGYLVVKPVKNNDMRRAGDRMLGCTNYKKDGTGCNFAMYYNNYTQDKTKFFKDENGRVVVSQAKSDAEKILKIINNIYLHYPLFKFNYKTLLDYLIGKENKVLEKWRFNELESFGIFKNQKEYILKTLLKILFELDVLMIQKTEKGFENIIIEQNELTESQCFALKDFIY